ncbi:MAG TPA: UDP-N-acetylglucosamine 1-carboxyvinyltransferase [Candidatus Saccharimonadales bacterium]|nr:UDP-N-acetylglucosamine 1-carboxyvinyltransferase [Candidatus Saccharimonadales bacterium]
MQRPLTINGGTPLIGNVKILGSKLSLQSILAACLFSNEDIILENVSQTNILEQELEMLRNLGVKAQWSGQERLIINAANLVNSDFPVSAKKSRVALFLAAPLLYRFGKVSIPMPEYLPAGIKSISRWIDTWQALGIEIIEESKFIHLKAEKFNGAHINFKTPTFRGTCNAILSALSVLGETTITNASEEPEIDSLIDFCNIIGGNVTRVEHRKIVVQGKHVFKGGYFELHPDRTETVMYAVAALVTGGNLTIQNVNRNNLTSFTNVLTKIGARFDFVGNELRVWRAGEQLLATNITTSPAPGFNSDWESFITLLMTKAEGISLIHDTIYTNRFGFIQELNRMGAKIDLLHPSDVNLKAVVSDDAYDETTQGEPYTVARVTGPTRLRGTKLSINENYYGATLILAAICAEGKTEISGYEYITDGYNQLLEKLTKLGAKFL